jgi:hypothetical protein
VTVRWRWAEVFWNPLLSSFIRRSKKSPFLKAVPLAPAQGTEWQWRTNEERRGKRLFLTADKRG